MIKKRVYRYFRFYLILFVIFAILFTAFCCYLNYQLIYRRFNEMEAANKQRAITYEVSIFEKEIVAKGNELFFRIVYNDQYSATLKSLCKESIPNENLLKYQTYELLIDICNQQSDTVFSELIFYIPKKNYFISSIKGYKSLSDAKNINHQRFADAIPTLSKQISWFSFTYNKIDTQQKQQVLAFGGMLPRTWSSQAQDAYLIGIINSDYVVSQLKNMTASDQVAYLVDADGNFLLSSTNEHSAQQWQESSQGIPLTEHSIFPTSIPINGATPWLYTSCSIEGTNWIMLYGTSTDSLYATLHKTVQTMLGVASLLLLIGLFGISLLMTKLYSPMRRIAQAAELLPEADSLPDNGRECDVILSMIQTLSGKLDNEQRLRYINRPIIRHTLIQALLKGQAMQPPLHTSILYEYDITPSYPYFISVILEFDIRTVAPTPSQQTLAFAILEALEEHPCPGVCCYGAVTEEQHIVLFINSHCLQEDQLHTCLQPMLNILLQSNIPYAVSAGNWVASLEELPLSFHEACDRLRQRFFATNDQCWFTEDVPMTSELAHTQLRSNVERAVQLLRQRRMEEAYQALLILITSWQSCHPDDAEQNLNLLCYATRSITTLKTVHGEEPLAYLHNPQFYFWRADELPQMIVEDLSLLSRPQADQRRNQVLSQTHDYILLHLNEELSLESVAEHMHFNPKYFSRMFKELSGSTFTDYVTTQRMQRACELLTTTESSLENIAEEVGYRSSSYFGRKFREIYGCTPKEFRNNDKQIT